ncbi:type II toxin-antitoxin system PemK/MazF family toxin [Salinimicrobium sp. CDJ15-81-2]|nr:type II toxin-antitoxin system PemK/MazF family toxin [Salinimicrobium nanhaiense]
MKQGEIWDVFLDPVSGSEQGGRRPCVIISGNLLNEHLQVVIICPLTTKIKKYKGNLLLNPELENGLEKESEVLTFHVRSISKRRLDKRIGKIKYEQVKVIKETLNDILRY